MPGYFVSILKELNQTVNQTVRSLSTEFSLEGMLLLIGISFLYGLVHSAGPGHGKLLVTSFFAKNKQAVRNVFALSGWISVIHSGFAVILSFLLFYIFTGVKGMMKLKLQSYFIAASGILILLVGIVFLVLKILKKDEPDLKLFKKSNNIYLVSIAAGIVPCPAALMIMLLTLGKNAVWVGLTAVAAISAGMFIILSVVGLLSLKSRTGLLALAANRVRRVEIVAETVEYLSIMLIILIGLGLVAGIML